MRVQTEGNKNVQDFLHNVAPLTLEEFEFAGDHWNKLNASFYLEGLHAVLKCTTILVSFGYCIFSSSELQSILIAAKNLKTLEFYNCKLDVTDKFDIKEETYHIEELMLWRWGGYSGWNDNIDGLEILVKAVANSPLKHSFRRIEILDENMDIEYNDKVEKIFERHDLQDVLQFEESWI